MPITRCRGAVGGIGRSSASVTGPPRSAGLDGEGNGNEVAVVDLVGFVLGTGRPPAGADPGIGASGAGTPAGTSPRAGRLVAAGEPGDLRLMHELLPADVDQVLVGVGHGDGSPSVRWGSGRCGGGSVRSPAAAREVTGRGRSRPRRRRRRCRPGRPARPW